MPQAVLQLVGINCTYIGWDRKDKHLLSYTVSTEMPNLNKYTVEPLYSGHHCGVLYSGVVLSQGFICTKRVDSGLSKVAFIERCPHVRGGLYEGFHCNQPPPPPIVMDQSACTYIH